MKKIFLAALICFVAATNTNAQGFASASASATIITPISIAKISDMDFGNLAVSPVAGGTVILEPSAAATRIPSAGGGVTLPAIAGTVSAAQFEVTGTANFTYDIGLPIIPVVLTANGGVDAMTLENFTTSLATGGNPAGTAGVLDGSGEQSFYLGAELTVGNAQPAGLYTTSSPFNITVNYN